MCVFADPTDPRNTGKIPLQHRPRIHEGFPFDRYVVNPSNIVEERFKPVLDQLMIIIAPCVTGNPAFRLLRCWRTGKRRIDNSFPPR